MKDSFELIKGDIFLDHRGSVHFVNDFDFAGIKRFYAITQPDTSLIRGWQGHYIETKWFFVAQGGFQVGLIALPDNNKPSEDAEIVSLILEDCKSEILKVPGGYLTSFKALVKNSVLMVYSDKNLEESKADDVRYELQYFKKTARVFSISGLKEELAELNPS